MQAVNFNQIDAASKTQCNEQWLFQELGSRQVEADFGGGSLLLSLPFALAEQGQIDSIGHGHVTGIVRVEVVPTKVEGSRSSIAG